MEKPIHINKIITTTTTKGNWFSSFLFFFFLLGICIFIYAFMKKYYIKEKNNDIKKNNNNKENMKILHLVLFSHDQGGPYDSMHQILSKYYKEFPHVKTIFYCFSPDISSMYELKDDILYIQGNETYVPGILDKTILALDYFKDEIQNNHDFVVRSNISTIVNFNILIPLLEVNPSLEYGGGYINTLAWMDEKGGVKDETWYGTRFGSGTSILLSKWVAQDVINRKDLIRRDIIDDLAIGIFIREHRKDIHPEGLPGNVFIFVPNTEGDKTALETMVEKGNYAFFRNHNGNREIDLEQMKILIDVLQKKHK